MCTHGKGQHVALKFVSNSLAHEHKWKSFAVGTIKGNHFAVRGPFPSLEKSLNGKDQEEHAPFSCSYWQSFLKKYQICLLSSKACFYLLFVCSFDSLFVYLLVCSLVRLFACMPACLRDCLFVCLFVVLLICLSVCWGCSVRRYIFPIITYSFTSVSNLALN